MILCVQILKSMNSQFIKSGVHQSINDINSKTLLPCQTALSARPNSSKDDNILHIYAPAELHLIHRSKDKCHGNGHIRYMRGRT